MLTALVVGLGIGLLQALTQIQEMTLVFVPKIIAIFVVLLIALPFAGAAMSGLMTDIAAAHRGLLAACDDDPSSRACPASSSSICWSSRARAR